MRWRIAAGPLVAFAILLVGALVSVSEDRRASTADDRTGAIIAQVSPQVAGPVLRAHVGADQPEQAGDDRVEIDP
jgi:multidrug resistance efflux pump